MSYSDGEALILNLVQELPDFGAKNATRADWTVLNSGKSDHYAILRRGSMNSNRVWQTANVYVASWQTIVEIWQRILPDSFETRTRLFEHAESVMTLLEYPTLGDTTGTIQDSSIPEMGEPEEMWKDGGALYLKLEIGVTWDEQREISFAE